MTNSVKLPVANDYDGRDISMIKPESGEMIFLAFGQKMQVPFGKASTLRSVFSHSNQVLFNHCLDHEILTDGAKPNGKHRFRQSKMVDFTIASGDVLKALIELGF